jgi:hypothetical protein
VCVWDGCPQQPEDEREQQHSWEDDAADPDEWRGGEPPFQGDEWKRRYWTGTPEERMLRELMDDDENGKGGP